MNLFPGGHFRHDFSLFHIHGELAGDADQAPVRRSHNPAIIQMTGSQLQCRTTTIDLRLHQCNVAARLFDVLLPKARLHLFEIFPGPGDLRLRFDVFDLGIFELLL